MNLYQLKAKTIKKTKTRLGRGTGSGKGKTSGRGTKGQKSRSGYNIPNRFEGGQTPIIQSLPKVGGFKSFNKKPLIIKLSQLDKNFSIDEVVTPEILYSKKLIHKSDKQKVKILFDKPIKKKFKIKNCSFSKNAEKFLIS